MTHSRIDRLSKSTHSVRPRLAAFTLLALVPLGCAMPASEEGRGDALEPTGEATEALTSSTLAFPLNQLPVEIKNVNSNKCLDIADSGPQQLGCNGGKNQTFMLSLTVSSPAKYQMRAAYLGGVNLGIAGASTADNALLVVDGGTANDISDGDIFGFEKQSDGSYRIFSTNSGKCLDIPNASTADHAIVQQYGCHTGTNQRWIITPRVNPMHLVAKHSARCIDVADASAADHANVQQYDCLEGDNQQWSIGSTTVTNGISYFTLVAKHSGKCMDVVNASTQDNARIQQYPCNNGDNQKWQAIENSDGYVTLKSKKSGLCLDVAGKLVTGNNTNMQQSTCSGGDDQRFYWANFDNRHIEFVQVAKSDGTGRATTPDSTVLDHVTVVNNIYGGYGLRLQFNPSVDKINVDSDALASLESGVFTPQTCPDGTPGSSSYECAARWAQANFPNKLVVFSRLLPNGGVSNGFSAGWQGFIVIGPLASKTDFVCGDVPQTSWLGHEFGHFMGLAHTFNIDQLSDTRPVSATATECLAPHTPTGVAPDGTVNDTNNVMSYFYNVKPAITPMQGSLTRATAFSRGY